MSGLCFHILKEMAISKEMNHSKLQQNPWYQAKACYTKGFVAWRGRRDLNPRAGFIQPTPLAGEPLRPLGYFRIGRMNTYMVLKMAERVGFEPTGTCAPPVFKTGSFNHSDISP